MNTELNFFGGAIDSHGLKPDMGGTSTLLKFGDYGLLVDFGIYPQPARLRKAEADKILNIADTKPHKPITSDAKGFPDLSSVSIEKISLPAGTDFPLGEMSELPRHRGLEEVKDLTVVATHGHADHVGGLPWLKSHFPKAKVFMTDETRQICSWSWHDYLAIVDHKNMRRDRSGHRHRMIKPLYSLGATEDLLESVKVVKVGDSITVGPAEVIFFFNPHILGAVSILAKIRDGNDSKNIFFTGDIRFKNQDLIPGMSIPTLQSLGVDHLDALVIESTYAGRTLPPFEDEAMRFAHDVRTCLADGGNFLAASLSMDRSQKLFAALKKYGVVNRFRDSIYIDGSAREISRIYAESLKDPLLDGISIHFVVDRDHRNKVILDSPVCVITSSGMYVGGPSVGYAMNWARNPKNVLARTSWQDPCSVGDKLDKIAPGQTIGFYGENITFNAPVKSYSFSGHCDDDEICSTFHSLKPGQMFAHHGEESGIDSLIDRLGSSAKKATIGVKYAI